MGLGLGGYTENELRKALQERESSKQDKRKAYKELVQEHVPALFTKLVALSTDIADMKAEVFLELQELVKNKKEAYGVKAKQQSHTLTTKSGISIMLGYRVLDGWDDTVGTGIAKISEFIASLAKDDDSAKLVGMINGLLKKDAKGNLKASRVMDLENMADEMGNDEFTDGVNIIRKAYRPERSCYFIEAAYKDEQGVRITIPLSMSSVEFGKGAEGIDFENL